MTIHTVVWLATKSLNELVRWLQSMLRADVIRLRYGGEEFAVVMAEGYTASFRRAHAPRKAEVLFRALAFHGHGVRGRAA